MTHADFAREYESALRAQVERHPEEYAYDASHIPGVVAKMLRAMADGTAVIEAAGKAAARRCGVKPNAAAIKEFLNRKEGAQ